MYGNYLGTGVGDTDYAAVAAVAVTADVDFVVFACGPTALN